MKNKKLFSLSCVVFCLLFSASSYVLADGNSKRELFFGPIVSNLEGTGLIASRSQEGAVPLIRTSLVNGKQETIHFSLDISQTSLNTIRSRDYVKIEGLKPHGNPGEPQIPFESFIVTLPVNSTISGISATNVSYRPILNKLDIVSAPMLVARTKNQKQKTEGNEDSVKIQEGSNLSKFHESYSKCKTCSAESFYPRNLVSYYTGKDNNNRYVFIKFFPMQYIPGSGRAILITNADITVNYQLTDSKQETE